MGILKKLKNIFLKTQTETPVVLITKKSDIKEFSCIEEAIKDLETDPDIPKEKIEKLRKSIEILKNKGKIRIQNGEIID
jgi:hypothetical protein